MINLLIADDHPLLLQGLAHAIDRSKYCIVAEAFNGNEALTHLREQKIDVAILDIEMPEADGFSVIKTCRNEQVKTAFIILTFHKEPSLLAYTKELGIMGYLLKEEVGKNINDCLEAVLKGQSYYSESLSNIPSHIEAAYRQLYTDFTPSERKILKLINRDFSSKEISEKLFVSVRTVEKHRSNIVSKLHKHIGPINLIDWIKENKVFIINL
ncbi:response regulator transcription factor [Marinilongibacter aquaticus]|uniref:response regulator transcription factor n=1 Tax=Marinilongibacter aquaticus TaxID=2975157 RepID=UPI0021BDB329|nr:response regulator transcription factor [Marinilongibacter aquaticus]UBM58533.1 response regulator transcription factor [Marinilongibacter aquaticus]